VFTFVLPWEHGKKGTQFLPNFDVFACNVLLCTGIDSKESTYIIYRDSEDCYFIYSFDLERNIFYWR